MSTKYSDFNEFYTFYLSQHSKLFTKIFHYLAVVYMVFVIIYVIQTGKERFLWYIPIVGFGLQALSHILFERNKPTFYKNPIYTLLADLRLFGELSIGKVKFKSIKNPG